MAKEKKEKIVQVGSSNWQKVYDIPDRLEWIYLAPEEIEAFAAKEHDYRRVFKEQQKKIQTLRDSGKKADLMAIKAMTKLKPPTKYKALVLTDADYPETILELEDLFEPYETFYDQCLTAETEWTKGFLHRKMAHPADFSDPVVMLNLFKKILFSSQYGAKIYVESLQVTDNFSGSALFDGGRYLVLDGIYGDDYEQIAYYNMTLPYDENIPQDLFLDHRCDDTVQTKIVVHLVQEGAIDNIIHEWVFDGNATKEELNLNVDASGSLFISLLAKGFGELKVGPCHYRFSRCGFGEFVLGGERFVDDYQDEFMYFFHPQDFKPPLCVYFSGFRTAEGFEGYGMMKAMGTPFLLICDPRLEGGSFYIGSDRFEQRISDVIQEKLDFLGFTREQLVLSGMSMGTFGASYHGSKLSPHAIVLSKPVLSLGEVALKEKISRPMGFPTSLDILKQFEGELTIEAADRLDNRFWNQFKRGDFSRTKFFIAYMQDDDYDSSAFDKIRQYVQHVVLRGVPGRHGDGGDVPVIWFLKQYQNILKNDFGREL